MGASKPPFFSKAGKSLPFTFIMALPKCIIGLEGSLDTIFIQIYKHH